MCEYSDVSSYEEDEGVWELLKFDNDFEINSKYPYPVRRVGTIKVLNERIDGSGYYKLSINKVRALKHRLIATQWVHNENPDAN